MVSICLKTIFLYISGVRNSKSNCYYNAKPSAYYFHVKTKISVDFHICISVPLMWLNKDRIIIYDEIPNKVF